MQKEWGGMILKMTSNMPFWTFLRRFWMPFGDAGVPFSSLQ